MQHTTLQTTAIHGLHDASDRAMVFPSLFGGTMNFKPFVGIAALTILSACSSEKEHDVQYYLDHPTERAAKIEECVNNPGKLDSTVNCVNAKEAQVRQEFSSKNKGMPSIRSN
ncbi:EexN family lipoprotein [Kerstersia sp.]|uniref:EexN family lipoprotein n=1 Tax=Kerstersia sp. TaxID=1930783 RepID=UPI003F9247D0